MLKLTLQYFGHLMRATDSLEKPLILGKIEGRRREWQRIRQLDGITDVMNMNLGKLWEITRDYTKAKFKYNFSLCDFFVVSFFFSHQN